MQNLLLWKNYKIKFVGHIVTYTPNQYFTEKHTEVYEALFSLIEVLLQKSLRIWWYVFC